jgi:hypothetical protein
MIARTISEQFVTVEGSRNYAQEGDVRLLASGDAGAVAFGNTGERRNSNAGRVQCQTPRASCDDQMASFLHSAWESAADKVDVLSEQASGHQYLDDLSDDSEHVQAMTPAL